MVHMCGGFSCNRTAIGCSNPTHIAGMEGGKHVAVTVAGPSNPLQSYQFLRARLLIEGCECSMITLLYKAD